MARAIEGDRAALRAIYDANVERIYRLAFRMTGDEEFARDATQDAFVRAFQRLDQYRGDASVATWLHTIAVSVVLNGLRRQRTRRLREIPMERLDLPAEEPSQDSLELGAHLREAIDALPEIYRTVFLMYDLEGYTHPEISQALGVPEGTSKARLSRARAHLRKMLSKFGIHVDGGGEPPLSVEEER